MSGEGEADPVDVPSDDVGHETHMGSSALGGNPQNNDGDANVAAIDVIIEGGATLSPSTDLTEVQIEEDEQAGGLGGCSKENEASESVENVEAPQGDLGYFVPMEASLAVEESPAVHELAVTDDPLPSVEESAVDGSLDMPAVLAEGEESVSAEHLPQFEVPVLEGSTTTEVGEVGSAETSSAYLLDSTGSLPHSGVPIGTEEFLPNMQTEAISPGQVDDGPQRASDQGEDVVDMTAPLQPITEPSVGSSTDHQAETMAVESSSMAASVEVDHLQKSAADDVNTANEISQVKQHSEESLATDLHLAGQNPSTLEKFPVEIDYVELHAPSVPHPAVEDSPLIFKHVPASAQVSSAVLLTRMVYILEKYNNFLMFDSKECFSIWKDFSFLSAVADTKRLEQRVQKLKGLLARTHQARQRTLEDNTLSQQRARELLNSKTKDEHERNSLLQAIRAKEEETERERAFHYDMEILIQRAASEISSLPATPLVSRHSKTQLDDLEGDLMQARAELKDMELRLENSDLELLTSKEKLSNAMQDLAISEEQRLALEKSLKVLQSQLTEETNSRIDVERELKVLISRQSELASEIEHKMKLRYDLRKIEVNEELEFTRGQLEKALFDLRTVESRQNEMRRELDSALSKLNEANRVLSENAQLKDLLEEIKKTSFSQLSAAEQRHEKAAEIAADLVKVGLNAAKNTVALEAQVAEMVLREKQVL